MKDPLENLFEELIASQNKRMMDFARTVIPHLTTDDILQPFDFPELEQHPFFRYEEGVAQGLLSAKIAYLAWKKET